MVLLYEIANSLLNKHRWLKHLPRCKLNKLRKFMLEYNDDTFYKIVSLSTTNNQEITGNLSRYFTLTSYRLRIFNTLPELKHLMGFLMRVPARDFLI